MTFSQVSPDMNIVYTMTDSKDKNKFVFKLLPQEIVIKRSLTDLYWLRANLCIEFPYYIIPPIKGEDFKENFIQNFFRRLLNLPYVTSSEVLNLFLSDEKFNKIKKTEPTSVDA